MNKRAIKKLVEIGLKYDVDKIYILEEIERILNGKEVKVKDIKIEDYM
jgi:hypothetical protein